MEEAGLGCRESVIRLQLTTKKVSWRKRRKKWRKPREEGSYGEKKEGGRKGEGRMEGE